MKSSNMGTVRSDQRTHAIYQHDFASKQVRSFKSQANTAVMQRDKNSLFEKLEGFQDIVDKSSKLISQKKRTMAKHSKTKKKAQTTARQDPVVQNSYEQ